MNCAVAVLVGNSPALLNSCNKSARPPTTPKAAVLPRNSFNPFRRRAMLWKMIKYGGLTAGAGLLAGGLVLGSDFGSYLRSSCRSMQVAVKDNIPVEFELRRARDLLDGVGPELHENIRLVAEQEVEIGSLKSDLQQSRQALVDERHRIQKLRD